jgi:hypothetical protein
MSEIGKAIDGIVTESLAPLLKKNGFKKTARNFYRAHEDRIDVINVQASQWNHGNEGQFTVNVGVYYPSIAEIINAPPIKGMPKEYDCTIRERVGSLTAENKDTWWLVDSNTDRSRTASDLATKVDTLCLPWLDKMSNLDSVKEGVAKNWPLVAAGIALFQGRESEAKAFVEQSFKQQPMAKSRAMVWGKKHGLLSP